MRRIDEEEAKKILFDKTPTDRIIETRDYGDCWEFIVSCGGDVSTYRIYGDGEIYER